MSEPFFANSPEELPGAEELAQMSGLEFIQAIMEGQIAAPPISRLMNYRLTEAEKGRVVFRGAPSFDVYNPLGTAHGGWYGTLLDSCMACAIQTMVGRGRGYTTLEYKINIIRPVPLGMEVDAIGEAQHVGRSTGVAVGRMVGVEDGRVYATGSTTCIVMTPRG
ncbi:MAG: PaaI family thioesterase [Alphaproteobacteria bacterium]|nr:MAG: PaaI family thioesterase [Alphaproteobacteria bacterium]